MDKHTAADSRSYISWHTAHGITTAYVIGNAGTPTEPRWRLRASDGVTELYERLPRGWRLAGPDEIERFERIRAGRTEPVNYQ